MSTNFRELATFFGELGRQRQNPRLIDVANLAKIAEEIVLQEAPEHIDIFVERADVDEDLIQVVNPDQVAKVLSSFDLSGSVLSADNARKFNASLGGRLVDEIRLVDLLAPSQEVLDAAGNPQDKLPTTLRSGF